MSQNGGKYVQSIFTRYKRKNCPGGIDKTAKKLCSLSLLKHIHGKVELQFCHNTILS